MKTTLLTVFAAMLIVSVAAANDVAVTIYNQSFASVKANPPDQGRN